MLAPIAEEQQPAGHKPGFFRAAGIEAEAEQFARLLKLPVAAGSKKRLSDDRVAINAIAAAVRCAPGGRSRSILKITPNAAAEIST